MLTEDTIKIEEHLADRDWIVGDALSAADICVASRLVLVLPASFGSICGRGGRVPVLAVLL